MGAISTDKYSVFGQETVGIQDPVGTQSKVMINYMQYAFATTLLDHLKIMVPMLMNIAGDWGLGSTLQTPDWGLNLPRNSKWIDFGIYPPFKKLFLNSNR